MKNFTIPAKLEPEAKSYMEEVLRMLEDNGIIEKVDDAALQMLSNSNAYLGVGRKPMILLFVVFISL